MNEASIAVPWPHTYWVVPDWFLAGEHPRSVDEPATETRLNALLDAGIRTFVDLTGEDDLVEVKSIGLSYQPLLRHLAENRQLEITYARIPIKDSGIPSVWTFRCILDMMDRSVADENPVFVHCRAGVGRTGTVVGCYLKQHGLASEEETVIGRLAELRRFIPSGHRGCGTLLPGRGSNP